MKKEAIIAIVLGILFGVSVGLVMLIKTSKQTPIETTNSIMEEETRVMPSVVISGEEFQPLEVSSPIDETLVRDKSISVTGKTNVNSLVVIQTPSTKQVFKAESMEFTKEIPLALGENVIKITSYAENSKQNPQQKELRVFYIPEE